MKYALAALAALSFAMPMSAQVSKGPQVYLKVNTADLDLSSQAGAAKLTIRFLTQMHDICGGASDAGRYASQVPGMLSAHNKAFATCKHNLALQGEQPQVVQDAFLGALKKMGGPE